MNRAFTTTVVVVVALAVAMGCRRPNAGQEGGQASGPVLTPGTPTPAELSQLLGVDVEAASGEVNQFLLRAPQGSVDLSKVGTVHQDLGYAVGVTLPNGTQIGFRYEPSPASAAKPSVSEQKAP